MDLLATSVHAAACISLFLSGIISSQNCFCDCMLLKKKPVMALDVLASRSIRSVVRTI